MPYYRFKNNFQLNKTQKLELLSAYFEYYRQMAKESDQELNVKLIREAYSDLLNQIGEILVEASAKAAVEPGPVREFLQVNRLPAFLQDLLPDDFRAFCLVLNALKQWLSAEQAATDRYLLGGTARALCRNATKTCVVTGENLDGQTIELHHPVRDGRPPIPISKAAHSKIEGQEKELFPKIEKQELLKNADSAETILRSIKGKGHHSWVQLRLGCLALSGNPVTHKSPGILSTSKTFARKAAAETGMDYGQLIEWLDARKL